MVFWNKLIGWKEIPEKIPEFPEIWHKSPEIPELSKWLGIAITNCILQNRNSFCWTVDEIRNFANDPLKITNCLHLTRFGDNQVQSMTRTADINGIWKLLANNRDWVPEHFPDSYHSLDPPCTSGDSGRDPSYEHNNWVLRWQYLLHL